MDISATAYPGERVSAGELRRLAEAYRGVAYVAAGSIQRGDPFTAAPMRLLALHTVELNLSAFLLLKGHSALDLRRLGHDLGARIAFASGAGLVLRRRTAEHVEAVGRDREYLVARYGPELLGTASQVNRLLATMDEVAVKVGLAFAVAPAGSRKAGVARARSVACPSGKSTAANSAKRVRPNATGSRPIADSIAT